MGAIIAKLVPLLAGLGIGEILEKVLPGQYRTYLPADRPKTMEGIIKFIAFFAVTSLIWGFVSKKLKLPVKFR